MLPLVAAVSRRLGLYEKLFLSPLKNLESQGRILFVCKGNICRSSYAEHKLRAMLGEKTDWRLSSAGTDTSPNLPANEVALRLSGLNSLETHKTKELSVEEADAATVIFIMCPMQLQSRIINGNKKKIVYLGALGEQLVIRDPYGKDDLTFKECFRQIDAALESLLKHL